MKELWRIFCELYLCSIKRVWVVVTVCCFNVIAALLEGSSFTLIIIALHILEKTDGILSCPLFSLNLSCLMNCYGREFLFIALATCSVVAQIIRSAFSFWSQCLSVAMGAKMQIQLQNKIYTQIMSLSFSCINRYKIGDLADYAKSPSVSVYGVVDHLNKAFVLLLNIAALIGIMFFTSPFLTSLMLIVVAVIGIVQKSIIRRITECSVKFFDSLTEFNVDIIQTLHCLRAVFLFDRHKEIVAKTRGLLYRIAAITKKFSFLNNLIPSVTEVSGVFTVSLFLILGYFFGGDGISLSALLAFITIAYRLNGKMQQCIQCLMQVAYFWGQVKKMDAILRNDDKEFASEEGAVLTTFHHEIAFKNVSFSYPNSSSLIIQNLSCHIPKGKVTAFVGVSGAGKSSLLDLLLRLYEPTQGSIVVDNIPIAEINVHSWRRIFGVVSQEAFLFNDTIEANIRFGYENASQEELLHVATLAGVDEFVANLPQTYQTVVGERGYRLSGGEKQRLSLARALLRRPQILVLDEPTSHLDSKSEHVIKQSLAQIQKETTLLIVAHRLSTITHADQIIVIERGAIKEMGTHQALIASKGTYAFLWTMQSQAGAQALTLK